MLLVAAGAFMAGKPKDERNQQERLIMRTIVLRQGAIVFAAVAIAAPAWAQDQEKTTGSPAPPQQVARKLSGRVVNQSDKPVAGVEISRLWYTGRDSKLTAYEPVKTAADGSFSVDVTFYYGRPHALATIDTAHKLGGLALVEPKNAGEPVTIKVGPLIHFHGKYECKELGTPVGWTNTILFAMPGRVNFCNFQSTDAQFDFWLPPGTYQIQGYGSSDVAQHKREVTLDAAKPDLNIGAIDLAASQIAKLKGKEAPSLLATDARGVNKSVQIADYKGKWVALEFWGYWCGPCVSGALPRMMEIYDDHQEERDKFVVLTVHAPDTKGFPDLDEKVKPVVRDIWAGRMIPFPILLDADSQIQQTFGVSHWPTTLLFDPEGKLIGEVQPDTLESKLKKVPIAVTLPRKLERNTIVHFANPTLKEALANLKTWTKADYELDAEALNALGLSEATKVPLVLSGQVSLRSALELLLDPLNLTATIGANGYRITCKPSVDSSTEMPLSRMQQTCAARIERKLKDSKYSFDFNKATLAQVAAFFEQQSTENVVLDPRGRLQGKIDPEAAITGSGQDVPLGEALEKLVGPLGLRAAIRDEVIVLEAK
jgi:thiol-disulfide isomerase/thioredoxin